MQTTHGPSLAAPWPAVIARVRGATGGATDARQAQARIGSLLPDRLGLGWGLPDGRVAMGTLAAGLAQRFATLGGPADLPVQQAIIGPDSQVIALGYDEPEASHLALLLGVRLAIYALAPVDDAAEAAALAEMARQTVAQIAAVAPDFIARPLLRAARRRGIPVRPVAPGGRIWAYGHGCRRVDFFEVATGRDTLTGTLLARNKSLTNQLIARLGFPGTQFGLASDFATAAVVARTLGYPVVVKPIDGGKGVGVTADIRDEAGLHNAVQVGLSAFSPTVLVEKHVAGDDHRMAVIGGRFAWVYRRRPAEIIGDGRRTVRALIEDANRQRDPALVAAGYLQPLVVDADMLAVLQRAGLGLDAVPPAGGRVGLRTIANLSAGGMLEEVTTQVHPDNIAMAEAIARSFGLDAAGIDYITPDISQSWRMIASAVIEVNGTPAISDDRQADVVMARAFPAGEDGRIATVVTVDATADLARQYAAWLGERMSGVGLTDPTQTALDGVLRHVAPASLPATLGERAAGLLLDPATRVLVVSLTLEAMLEHGLPVERCDLLIGRRFQDWPQDLRALGQTHARSVQPLAEAETLTPELLAACLHATIARPHRVD